MVPISLASAMSLAAQTLPEMENPLPTLSAADRVWLDVQMLATPLPPSGTGNPQEPQARLAQQQQTAARFLSAADRAKAFYEQYPQHPKAAEARLLEVRSLVSAAQSGDATAEDRAEAAVQALRSDGSIPAAIRVQAVSAHEFSRATRRSKDRDGRLKAIERVARNLATEFPDQPQGAESLLTVASQSDDATARKIAGELAESPAAPEVKVAARALLSRLSLVGKTLAIEFDGAGLPLLRTAFKAGQPTVIYTWATSSPGSLRLAAELKKRGLAANIIGLNLDTDKKAAETLAQKEGLIGTLLYDERGLEGSLAQRWKLRRAPQVFLVDAQGVIRDVRGEGDLNQKLKQLGL